MGLSLAVCGLLFCSVEAHAVRAKGGWHSYRQPDGTAIMIDLRGDEHFHYYVTPSGRHLVADAEGWLKPLSETQWEQQQTRARALMPKKLSPMTIEWDSTKVYRSPVVLISFSDRDFHPDFSVAYYDSLFNVRGFNKGKGKGCVADYFREQSGGLLNLQFDVFGPVKVPYAMKKGENSYTSIFSEAVKKIVDSLQVDLSTYDWDGDGTAEQVACITAGYGGNDSSKEASGCIWPRTGTFTTISTPTGSISKFTASCEMWASDERSCGIGTICHEFTHCLGLPDLYPTSGSEYSVLDEWSLMDGGNYINKGWCPPNFSPHEKMLMGWLTPIELTEATRIDSLKPVSEGGETYRVSHTDNEYYLLQNRQWTGWDLRTPGHGLLIWHVDYLQSAWKANTLNNSPSHHRYELVHADNMDYNDWDVLVGNNSPYVGGHSTILSTSPYPLTGDERENRRLTDTSTPAAQMFNRNDSGSNMLSKPIVHIEESEEGLISFDFMKGEDIADGIANVAAKPADPCGYYDLSGRKIVQPLTRGITIERTPEGVRKLRR